MPQMAYNQVNSQKVACNVEFAGPFSHILVSESSITYKVKASRTNQWQHDQLTPYVLIFEHTYMCIILTEGTNWERWPGSCSGCRKRRAGLHDAGERGSTRLLHQRLPPPLRPYLQLRPRPWHPPGALCNREVASTSPIPSPAVFAESPVPRSQDTYNHRRLVAWQNTWDAVLGPIALKNNINGKIEQNNGNTNCHNESNRIRKRTVNDEGSQPRCLWAFFWTSGFDNYQILAGHQQPGLKTE